MSDKEIIVSANETETKKKTSFFRSRGFKYGSLATALTAALIVLVIAANMVLSLLTDTYSWSIDFTSTGMYEISDATRQVIDSLDEDVQIEITIFYEETEYPHYIAEPIKRFSNLSDNISYTYVDPEKNPGALTQYGTEYKIEQGAVVVKCGDRIRVFNVADYFEADTENGSMNIFIEERLVAGVLHVTKDEIPVVYFLNGNGESGYEGFMNLIANNGADVKEVSLSTGLTEFDPNAKCMVICNPTRDYSNAEIRKIQDFLANDNLFGTNLMYFTSAEASEVPNLEAFLKEYGITFNKDLVLDSEYSVGTGAYPYLVIPQTTTEEIMNTGSKLSSVTSPVVSYARSIELLFEENSIYKTQPIFTSYPNSSYSKPADAVTTTWEKEEGDKGGPLTLSALSMKYKYVNNVQVQNYVYVSGSSDMLKAEYLSYMGNGEILMQLYKTMVNEQDETIVAAQKSSSSTFVTLTQTQARTMAAIVLGLIPFIFLVIGIVVYVRRRFL